MQTQTAQRSFVPRRRILLVLVATMMLLAVAALGIERYGQSEPAVSQAEPATPLVVNRPSDRPSGIADLPQATPCVPPHVPSDRLDANFGVATANDGC